MMIEDVRYYNHGNKHNYTIHQAMLSNSLALTTLYDAASG